MNLTLIKSAIKNLEDDHDGEIESSLISYLTTLESELIEAGFEQGGDLIVAERNLEELLNEIELDESDDDGELDETADDFEIL